MLIIYFHVQLRLLDAREKFTTETMLKHQAARDDDTFSSAESQDSVIVKEKLKKLIEITHRDEGLLSLRLNPES